jgi:hypothetical protein
MGIVKNNGKTLEVIEATRTAKETPLRDWIGHGLLKRAAIYRDPDLTPEQAKQILAAARALYGKPYDIFFSFNNDAIYCSELPYLSYKAAGISIGKSRKCPICMSIIFRSGDWYGSAGSAIPNTRAKVMLSSNASIPIIHFDWSVLTRAAFSSSAKAWSCENNQKMSKIRDYSK